MLLRYLGNRRFPRWSGPLIGGLVGGYVGLRNLVNPGGLPIGWMVLGGVLIGGFAGSLAILLDPKRTENLSEGLPDHLTGANQVPAGFVGRVLALFGLMLCWFPFIGLALNLIGVLVNRGTEDWALLVSKFGLFVGVIVSLVTLAGIILGW